MRECFGVGGAVPPEPGRTIAGLCGGDGGLAASSTLVALDGESGGGREQVDGDECKGDRGSMPGSAARDWRSASAWCCRRGCDMAPQHNPAGERGLRWRARRRLRLISCEKRPSPVTWTQGLHPSVIGRAALPLVGSVTEGGMLVRYRATSSTVVHMRWIVLACR